MLALSAFWYFAQWVFSCWLAYLAGRRPQCSAFQPPLNVRGFGLWSDSGTPASNRQNTENPKYNDDISLLISQYLISAVLVRRCTLRFLHAQCTVCTCFNSFTGKAAKYFYIVNIPISGCDIYRIFQLIVSVFDFYLRSILSPFRYLGLYLCLVFTY